jgi:N-acetyl-anhydromuramyl-L-alanine amidase AmpD
MALDLSQYSIQELQDLLGQIKAKGSDASQEQAATTPQVPLSDIRIQFRKEMESDPSVYKKLLASMQAEVGDQGEDSQVAYAETVMNRARARGMTLSETLSDPKYYPKSTLDRLNQSVSVDLHNRFNPLVHRVLEGSNITNFATGNESADQTSGNAPITYKSGQGERFVLENRDKDWTKNIVGSDAGSDGLNLITDIRAQSNSFRKGRGGNQIQNIILHSTDGTEKSDLNQLTTGGVSAHYYVTRDGRIYNLVNDQDSAFHAGQTIDNARFGNGATLGIEQEHIDGKEDWPDIQVQATAKLVSTLQKKYGLNNDNILRHSDIAPERKVDPVDYPWHNFFSYVGGSRNMSSRPDVSLASNTIELPEDLSTYKLPTGTMTPEDISKGARYQALQIAKGLQDAGTPLTAGEFKKLVLSQYGAIEKAQAGAELKEIPGQQLEGLSVYANNFDILNNLKKLHAEAIDAGAHGFGSWAAAATQDPNVDQEGIKFNTALEAAVSQIARGLGGQTGVLTDKDLDVTRRYLPQPGDSKITAANKIKVLQEQTQTMLKRKLEFYQGSGYQTAGVQKVYDDMTNFLADENKKSAAAPGSDQKQKQNLTDTVTDQLVNLTTQKKKPPVAAAVQTQNQGSVPLGPYNQALQQAQDAAEAISQQYGVQ